MRLQGIAVEHIDAAWPLVEKYISRATADSPHFRPEDIREACKARDMSLWALVEGDAIVGALTTEIVISRRAKIGRIVIAAAEDGYRDSWLPLRAELEAWARSYGCKLMNAEGRIGWAAVLPDAKKYVLLEWSIADAS